MNISNIQFRFSIIYFLFSFSRISSILFHSIDHRNIQYTQPHSTRFYFFCYFFCFLRHAYVTLNEIVIRFLFFFFYSVFYCCCGGGLNSEPRFVRRALLLFLFFLLFLFLVSFCLILRCFGVYTHACARATNHNRWLSVAMPRCLVCVRIGWLLLLNRPRQVNRACAEGSRVLVQKSQNHRCCCLMRH